jgi:hypothetical protein
MRFEAMLYGALRLVFLDGNVPILRWRWPVSFLHIWDTSFAAFPDGPSCMFFLQWRSGGTGVVPRGFHLLLIFLIFRSVVMFYLSDRRPFDIGVESL